MGSVYYVADHKNRRLFEIGKRGFDFREAVGSGHWSQYDFLALNPAPGLFNENELKQLHLYCMEAGWETSVVDEQDAHELSLSRYYGYVPGWYGELCPSCGLGDSDCSFDPNRDGVIELQVSGGGARLPSSAFFFLFPSDVSFLAPKEIAESEIDIATVYFSGPFADMDIKTTGDEGKSFPLLVYGKFAGDTPETTIITSCEQRARVVEEAGVKSIVFEEVGEKPFEHESGAIRRISHEAIAKAYGDDWQSKFAFFPKRLTPKHEP